MKITDIIIIITTIVLKGGINKIVIIFTVLFKYTPGAFELC